MFQAVTVIGRPVAHLHVYVEVVVTGPGRHLVLLDPGSLQGRSDPEGTGQPSELVHPVFVEKEKIPVGNVDVRYIAPVGAPPFAILPPQAGEPSLLRSLQQARGGSNRRVLRNTFDCGDTQLPVVVSAANAQARISRSFLRPAGKILALQQGRRFEADALQVIPHFLPCWNRVHTLRFESGRKLQGKERFPHV